MHTVQNILSEKGNQVWTIDQNETVYRALETMAEHSVGALVVIEGEQPVGILSERDYARKVAIKGRTSKTTLVREIMTSEILVALPDWPVERCMRVMTDSHIRHLPVIKEDRLQGIISIGDVVKAIISHQHYVIDQLSRYVQIQID